MFHPRRDKKYMGLLRQVVAIREMSNPFRGSGMIPLLSSLFIPFSVGIKKEKRKQRSFKSTFKHRIRFQPFTSTDKSYSTITVSVIITTIHFSASCFAHHDGHRCTSPYLSLWRHWSTVRSKWRILWEIVWDLCIICERNGKIIKYAYWYLCRSGCFPF